MNDAFQEWDTVTEMKMVGAIFTAMDVFLGGVGIVTLGLGAVGIINIMLVSVTERTSEIGLRKALGATKRSILTQFFWEGLLLTGVSGAMASARPRSSWECCRPCSWARCPAGIRRGWFHGPPRWPCCARRQRSRSGALSREQSRATGPGRSPAAGKLKLSSFLVRSSQPT